MNYKEYYKKRVINTLIGCIVWSGLSTYVIISKSQIGVTNIPIFECALFLISIVTSRYIARNKLNYAVATSIDIGVEFIGLLAVLILTVVYGVGGESAVALYMLIIATSGVTSILLNESERDVEDKILRSEASKKFLKKVRGMHRDYRLYGLTIGGVFSLLLLTYANMDLKTYAILLLSLNMMQSVYDSYLVRKYLILK